GQGGPRAPGRHAPLHAPPHRGAPPRAGRVRREGGGAAARPPHPDPADQGERRQRDPRERPQPDRAVTPRPVPALAAVTAYRPPAHPAPIDLPLAGNEGAAPAPALVAELARTLDGEALRRYPTAAALEAAL